MKNENPFSLKAAGWVLYIAGALSSAISLYDYYQIHSAGLVVTCNQDVIVLSTATAIAATSSSPLDFISPKDVPAERTAITTLEIQNSGEDTSDDLHLSLDGVSRFIAVTGELQRLSENRIISQRLHSVFNREKGEIDITGLPRLLPQDTVRLYIFADRISFTDTSGIKIHGNRHKIRFISMHNVTGMAWIFANVGLWIVLIGITFLFWHIIESKA